MASKWAALQWCSDAYSDSILGFANNIHAVDGGTHIEGLKTVLTRTLNAFADLKAQEADSNLAGENIREGLTAVLSVKVLTPNLRGRPKPSLATPKFAASLIILWGKPSVSSLSSIHR